MRDRCKICKTPITNDPRGRRKVYCDSCRNEQQDPYRKKARKSKKEK